MNALDTHIVDTLLENEQSEQTEEQSEQTEETNEPATAKETTCIGHVVSIRSMSILVSKLFNLMYVYLCVTHLSNLVEKR